MLEDEKAPFTEHLEELRNRLIYCFIAVVVGFILTYAFKEQLFKVLIHPLVTVMAPGDHLVFTGIPEAFFTYLKTALLAGLILAAPVILYQFWMFVAPGLYHRERRLLFPIVLISTLFFVGGALFGYFVVFPIGFKFFLGFSTDTLRPMLSMKEYLRFSSLFLLAFGVVFELPIVLTFLAQLGVVSVGFLKKNRKYAILLIFIVAAVLTPTPDVVSQSLMAFPLMILYEVGILGAKIFGKKKPDEASAVF